MLELISTKKHDIKTLLNYISNNIFQSLRCYVKKIKKKKKKINFVYELTYVWALLEVVPMYFFPNAVSGFCVVKYVAAFNVSAAS